MLLNVFDVDPGAAERTVELQAAELFELGLQLDLLVVSAYEGCFDPVDGTLIARLHQACGLDIRTLPRQLDLTGTPIGAWISLPVEQVLPALRWPASSQLRFQRIAVVESSRQEAGRSASRQSWPAFRQLFSLLAVLPLHGLVCPVVATPLLSAGNQGIRPKQLFPDLLMRCRDGFRHVPDLQRLIVFDRKKTALQSLARQIDAELGRAPGSRELMSCDELGTLFESVKRCLDGFSRDPANSFLIGDLVELRHLLETQQITPVALGIHSRRIVESLVLERVGLPRGSLYQGLQALGRMDVNPWVISCLHQVRIFGNWMVHPSLTGQRRAVEHTDVLSVLAALQRVLDDYPW